MLVTIPEFTDRQRNDSSDKLVVQSGLKRIQWRRNVSKMGNKYPNEGDAVQTVKRSKYAERKGCRELTHAQSRCTDANPPKAAADVILSRTDFLIAPSPLFSFNIP